MLEVDVGERSEIRSLEGEIGILSDDETKVVVRHPSTSPRGGLGPLSLKAQRVWVWRCFVARLQIEADRLRRKRCLDLSLLGSCSANPR